MISLLENLRLRRAHNKTPIEPPLLREPTRFPYGPFRFKTQLPKSTSCRVEATTNLNAWATIFSGISSGDFFEFVDSNASKSSYRFYRLTADAVLSSNIVGYVTVTLPPGFSLVANPLYSTDSRTSSLFKGMPDGTTVNKFESLTHALTENVLTRGRWTSESQNFGPGEGAIVFNPTSDYKSLSFVGDVLQGGFSIPVPAGFSLRSSLLPLPGRLDTELGFPVDDGDVVHLFDRDRQAYVLYPFNDGKWTPEAPVIGVGESFWIAKQAARNWVKTDSHSTSNNS
jgi:hypothetical protein